MLLPRFLEPGADGLQAEYLQALLFGLAVLLELAQQGPLAQLFQIAGFVRVGYIPAVLSLAPEFRGILG